MGSLGPGRMGHFIRQITSTWHVDLLGGFSQCGAYPGCHNPDDVRLGLKTMETEGLITL